MLNVSMLEKNVELFVITYNRAKYLDRTLTQLLDSPFARCKITILDNCSTDDTPSICETYRLLFPMMHIVRHRKNIGASPNYLRAVEMSDSPYTWVLCDDDVFDFSNCSDVVEAIEQGHFDLISLGAPGQFDWERGLATTSIELLRKGARYFFAFTFAPSIIFKTRLFDSMCMVKGYRNTDNVYPHFEFIRKSVQDNFSVYLSKKNIIYRDEHENVPSKLFWLTAWVNSCRTIDDRNLRKIAVYDTAENRISWVKDLVIAIVTEKIRYPERVLTKTGEMALGLSFEQLTFLLLISPLLLIPSSFFQLLKQVIYAIQGKAYRTRVYDEFRA